MNGERSKTLLKSRVALRRGGAAVGMAYQALAEVCSDSKVFRNKIVLVKPNAGFIAKSLENGMVTDRETVRGVVRFFRDAGAAKVLVGDGSIAGVDASEALEAAGMAEAARQEGGVPVNLDKGQPVQMPVENPMAVDRMKISSIALEADVLVSVPVMKSHMNTVVSLGIKNLKGCLHGREKQRFHHLIDEDRFRPWHGWKTLERAIADLYGVLPPHVVVLDGVVAMEGLGPTMGEAKPMGLVIASQSALAAEVAGLYVMGLHWRDVPHVFLSAEKAGDDLPEEAVALNLDRDALDEARSPFARALPEDIAHLFPHFDIVEGDACSACSATVTAFLKQSGAGYAGRPEGDIGIVLGKNVDPGTVNGRTILLGNCTIDLRERGRFIVGCPPVGSDIIRAISAIDAEDSAGCLRKKGGEP